MDIQFKKISNLSEQLFNHIKIINSIIFKMNHILSENNNINVNLNKSTNSLNEYINKKNFKNYNHINLSMESLVKENSLIIIFYEV